jgi:hypothetical protein
MEEENFINSKNKFGTKKLDIRANEPLNKGELLEKQE